MQVLKVGTMTFATQAGIAFGRFDLDDVGPPVGQLSNGRGASTHAGQVNDLEAGEGTCRHAVFPYGLGGHWNCRMEAAGGRGWQGFRASLAIG